MNIYVASAFADFERTRAAHAALTAMGHTITHDWTVEANNGPHIPRRERAAADLAGVESADLLLVLTSDRSTRGTWCELGAALTLGRLVIVVGPQADLIFCDLADRCFLIDADAFDFIRGIDPRMIEIRRRSPSIVQNITINVAGDVDPAAVLAALRTSDASG